MSLSHDHIWSQCLSLIKDNVNPQSYTTWFKPIEPIKLDGKKLTVQVPSQFFYEWLEQHYSELIAQVLTHTLGDGSKLLYSVVVNEKLDVFNLPSIKKPTQPNASNNGRQLSERYTFENYVEGTSNQFAKAASLAVAESPGNTAFNPLVIYGGVGLGKTHLIQAIGNFAISSQTVNKVMYVSSEKFTLEFINSIKNNKTTEFSNSYRNVDLLLVDDIQFFINKERTLEEFFHTFNTLYHNGKQIVLSSDRPPKELKGMEERLISRFQWGLVVDIQPPDYETRLAILHQKAEENGLDMPEEIFDFIASNITMNIRELEGSLIRLLAFSSLTQREINLELAKNVLGDICIARKKIINIEDLQRVVAKHFDIPEDMMRAKTRRKEVVLARQIAMYLAKETTDCSLKTIGLHFGGRDHTTVIHAIKLIEKMCKEDVDFKEKVDIIKKKLQVSLI